MQREVKQSVSHWKFPEGTPGLCPHLSEEPGIYGWFSRPSRWCEHTA